MKEQWKPVPGYKGRYSVSNKGRVRRDGHDNARVGKVLKPRPARHGYLRVALFKHGQRKDESIHVLVLLAFVGRRPGRKYEANHENGIKTDNRAKNLEWSTRRQNVRHAIRTGLWKRTLSVADVLEIRAECARPGRPTFKAIGKPYGLTDSMIRFIRDGKRYADAA